MSRRKESDILKIGMTTRNVQKLEYEVNSSTDMLYPLSVRKVFKVKKCKECEKEIHTILNEYRISADRDFFKIEYSLARNIIDTYFTENNLYYYDV